jgi:hypothetical protein
LEEEMRLPGAGGGGGNGIRFGAAREPPGRPPRDFNRLAGFRRSLALCPRSPASGSRLYRRRLATLCFYRRGRERGFVPNRQPDVSAGGFCR